MLERPRGPSNPRKYLAHVYHMLPLEKKPDRLRANSSSQARISERFANYRIGRALEERLPGLADCLRRHGAAISRIAKAGTVLAERLAAIARRGAAKRQTEAEYWQAARRAGETIATAREQAETQRRVKKRGLSR